MKYELCIYAGGTAILTDSRGETVWASDDDEEFAAEFDDHLSFEDGDDIAQYLEDAGYLSDDDALDIVESDDTGLHPALSDDEDDEDDEDDQDESYEDDYQ